MEDVKWGIEEAWRVLKGLDPSTVPDDNLLRKDYTDVDVSLKYSLGESKKLRREI